ncbi:TetR/AcrR family transcriptional regulator [Ketobacter sp.]|uniref:TetR/AcrR family transcriptional regulator n=1 Tax=Ketobacter sp. TaxID=2083498 RepID=UPI000F295D9B|nr:TetR/AcrR family transcriptional regulator [Ketobacter sp.]RLU01459.1 MAG: TetR/AcrR family transcriptional regulator [Ketobacter sp.]
MKCVSDFKRARQPEQIEQRRQDILSAAAHLMAEKGFDQVSLNAIARGAGVAKSNVYRYFESREEIFLTLLRQDWDDWLIQLEQGVAALKGSDDIPAFAALVADSIAACPRMCELVSVLASVLEQNLSEQALLTFKTESMALGVRIMGTVQTALPSLPSQNLMQIGHTLFALIAGLWPLGNPPPAVQKVMARPELAPFQIEFQSSLELALNLMLKGASKA